MRKKYTPHIIAVFLANTQENMTGFPNEPFYFLVIAVIPADFQGWSELGDPYPERNEGEQSSTDLAGQLGLENILSNLGKGRLPRPAKNAGLAMTDSLFTQREIPKGVSNYIGMPLAYITNVSCELCRKGLG